MKHSRVATLLFAFILLTGSHAEAATLFGKVIEVIDGDVIKIWNLNRPVRVRLIGVDAPEQNQKFGDVAKQHLTDLILDRNVVVEYLGLGHDGTIVGRVLLNDADINAQMIRDGVAWYDPSYKTELAEEYSEIYSKSEQAARSEKRGLWQDENAIAPWEFVKNEQAKRQALTNPVRSTNGPRPRTELSSESLLNSLSRTGTTPTNSEMSGLTSSSTKGWERFQPDGENFSAMVPPGGRMSREPIPFGNSSIDVNYYLARDGASVFALMWTSGPAMGESDSTVIKSTLTGFLRGVGAGYESLGGQFSCEPQTETDVSSAGFTGRSFDLKGCTIPAAARVYTRAVGAKRQLYLGAVFYMRDDSNVDKFLHSFAVTSNGSVKAARRAATEQNR